MAQGTIKIAYTDPLSGPFAQVGDDNLKQLQYILDYINAKGGALGRKFELVAFDNKSQPSDALIALKSATDQNMPFIMQCSGSNIAAALIEGVEKHNARNPDNRIIYINCGAVATELTNEKCSFWHFRFDAHVAMKAEVMARAMPKDVTKVYLLNQDYLFGQSVQRDVKALPRQVAARRPGGRRRADPTRQDQGLLALRHQDQGVRRAGADHRQLGPRHEPADQGGHRCRPRPALLHVLRPSRRRRDGDRPGRRRQGPLGDGVQREHRRETGNTEAEAWTKRSATSTIRLLRRRLPHHLRVPRSGASTRPARSTPTKFAYAMEGLKLKDLIGYK